MFDIDRNIPGTRSFLWREALWLPKWQVYVIPTQEQENEIIKLAYILQGIRDYFGKPINVKSWLRPQLYNELIGGSGNSYHVKGSACDFVVEGLSCDEVREKLEPRLEELKIRMERDDGKERVHIDTGEVIKNRYFYPK